MVFVWLKRFMPNGLYGRAALILVVPIVTIQLVVSIVFVQRYFSAVTLQADETSRVPELVAAVKQMGLKVDEQERRWAENAGALKTC